MRYAEVAVNVPVSSTFHYHIPTELAGKIEAGHLVRVAFGTAMQPGIVMALHDESPVQQTKPILEKLDPLPVVNARQIDLAQWMSRTYLAPIGPCLWLMLPPGMVGRRDVLVTLVKPEAQGTDALQMKVIDALKRRGPLRGEQIARSVKDKSWEKAVDALDEAGVVETESILAPPRVKPQVVQVAALAIHPDRIPDTLRHLGKRSRESDLLEAIANMLDEDDVPPTVDELLALPDLGQATLDKLFDRGLVSMDGDGHVLLEIAPEDLDQTMFELRDGELDLRILRVLAREDGPVDVSWVYAQTGAKLDDLKRLAEREFIRLGEKQAFRDPLADRDFVPLSAPRLTPGQRKVWAVIREAVGDPLPASPVDGGGGESSDGERINWQPPPHLWRRLKPLAREMRREPTGAEKKLWERLRRRQLRGYKFRRQYAVERFIVDFICKEARLIVEVDGEIHQYTRREDAVRQEFLESLGFRVLRFSNDEVHAILEEVVRQIAEALPSDPTLQSSIASLPEDGEGKNRATQSSPLSAREAGEGATTSPAFLLHGVTGSGKTEIYLRAIERALAQGRQAIFLVPEIALTAQTVRRVAARFPGKVTVLGEDEESEGVDSALALVHSSLKKGERYDTWRRARAGDIGVIVGTRSALFTPLPDVGLVILDEEHDSSYKQAPPISPPYYHARDVAERMMRDNGGVLILGSATPDVGTYYRAQRGEITYLHLPDRIMGHRVRIMEQAEREGVLARYEVESSDHSDALTIDLPPVKMVDMRAELKSGNTDIFSRELQESLAETLAQGQQAILFLNRRGASTYVFCRDCGYVATCPRCDMPLTYHSYSANLHCHHCGYHQASPETCPECGSRRIKYFGAGTQHVEAAVKRHFPNARALRWDADTAASASAHDIILQRFVTRQADVLIGTQMIAKGLDLPLVTLVGVVSADMGLALPDFRAGERIFQLLAQVAGRAGRGLLGGKVILQTYKPNHYAIRAAAGHDYAGFYEQEIAYRREMGYPPFRRIVRVLFRYSQQAKARDEAHHAASLFQKRIDQRELTGTELIGPAPCFFSRINRVYRWQVLLRGPDPVAVLEGLDFPRGWFVDTDPVDIL